jgi:sugar phosphate isomerase/epimerase
MFTHEDPLKREEVKTVFREFIDLAKDFGGLVNIGRVRGRIGDRPRQRVEELFIEVARDLCGYAMSRSVCLILEPVNRYEIDFINSVEEGMQLLEKINMPNMKLMPDTFHMNIEDQSPGAELRKYIRYVQYIHFADSNRLAPGQGHINFDEIFQNLRQTDYDGWISVEILPRPDPDTAARQAAQFLLPRIRRFNADRVRPSGERDARAESGL